MPAARGHRIDRVLDAVDAHVALRLPLIAKGPLIMVEYILLGGCNDSDADAEALGDLLENRFAGRLMVNLIPYNPTPDLPYDRPTEGRARAFQAILTQRGLLCCVRVTMGSDVAGACGQLLKKKRGAVDIEDAAGGAPRRAGGRRAPSPRRGARRRRRRRRRRAHDGSGPRRRSRSSASGLPRRRHRLDELMAVVVSPSRERQTPVVWKAAAPARPGIGDEVRRHAQRCARPGELVLEAPERVLDRRREPARPGTFGKGSLRPRFDRAVREVDVHSISRELAPYLRQRRRGARRGEDAREVIRCQRLWKSTSASGARRVDGERRKISISTQVRASRRTRTGSRPTSSRIKPASTGRRVTRSFSARSVKAPQKTKRTCLVERLSRAESGPIVARASAPRRHRPALVKVDLGVLDQFEQRALDVQRPPRSSRERSLSTSSTTMPNDARSLSQWLLPPAVPRRRTRPVAVRGRERRRVRGDQRRVDSQPRLGATRSCPRRSVPGAARSACGTARPGVGRGRGTRRACWKWSSATAAPPSPRPGR